MATIASSAQSITSPFGSAIRRTLRCAAGIAAAVLLGIAHLSTIDGSAKAGDVAPALRPWTVQDLEGAAFSRAHGADENQWRALGAGAQLAPGSAVRTDGSGRMELTNGIDTIRMSPSSEIELPAGKEGDPVTHIIQWVGTAFFHVGKRPGPQFEVDTPYIVAIVKGTKFTIAVADDGASIKVSEGVVGVSAAAGGSSIDVTAGGSASVSADHRDTVVPGSSGAADPAGSRGKGSTLAGSSDDGDAQSGSAGGSGSVVGGGGATARGGHGGNGNGRGRDDRANEGSGALIGNGSGEGGVHGNGDDNDDDNGGDDDGGGGCFGHHGDHHGGHDHGGHHH